MKSKYNSQTTPLFKTEEILIVWQQWTMTQNSLLKFFSLLIIYLWAICNDIQVDVEFSSLGNLRYSRWPPRVCKYIENQVFFIYQQPDEIETQIKCLFLCFHGCGIQWNSLLYPSMQDNDDSNNIYRKYPRWPSYKN